MPLAKWLLTTPGQLRVASVVLVGALAITLAVTVSVTSARGRAATAVGRETVPELVSAKNLYGSLAAADATESVIFLQAGLEDRALRGHYEKDISDAADHLVAVGREVGSSSAERAAVSTITRLLPVYTGYVENARTNLRQGFPVGASYLRQASGLMRDRILPAATALYIAAADRLDANYRDGSASTHVVLVVSIGIAVVALLVAVQVLVGRRSRRILNLPLVAATLIVFAVTAVTLLRFVSTQDSLVHAQRNGSDPVQLLSASSILARQAQSDENLALSERGTGGAYLSDFDVVMGRLGSARGPGALLDKTRTAAQRTTWMRNVDELRSLFSKLMRLHNRVDTLDDSDYRGAVALATGTQAAMFDRFDDAIRADMSRAEHVLSADAADARAGYAALAIAIPVLIVLAGALVVRGLQRRIAEYS
jgi:hypothetical protein